MGRLLELDFHDRHVRFFSSENRLEETKPKATENLIFVCVL